jgi:hypothetical protein
MTVCHLWQSCQIGFHKFLVGKTVIDYISSHFEISDQAIFKRLRDVACVILGFEHIFVWGRSWLVRKTMFLKDGVRQQSCLSMV